MTLRSWAACVRITRGARELLGSKRREAREACVARHREHGPSIAAEESELDTCVDRLLHIFRDRLEHWAVFTRAGIERIIEITLTDQEKDALAYSVDAVRKTCAEVDKAGL